MIAALFWAPALALAASAAPAVKAPVSRAATPVAPVVTTQAVPVLNRVVERGETLSGSDFTMGAVLASLARNALPPEQAVGQQAVRRLNAGSPVKATDLTAPPLVRRGENVTISLISGGPSGSLVITSAGRALSNAGKGESLRVLNLATNRTIDAIAEASGDVRLYVK